MAPKPEKRYIQKSITVTCDITGKPYSIKFTVDRLRRRQKRFIVRECPHCNMIKEHEIEIGQFSSRKRKKKKESK